MERTNRCGEDEKEIVAKHTVANGLTGSERKMLEGVGGCGRRITNVSVHAESGPVRRCVRIEVEGKIPD